MAEWNAALDRAPRNLRRLAGAHCAATAKKMQADAIANMSALGIGLITGRSRSLYGARVSTGAYMSSGSVAAYAGYLNWPDDVEFYPRWLNDGTRKMPSRPYHDLAFEGVREFFYDGMQRAAVRAMEGAT